MMMGHLITERVLVSAIVGSCAVVFILRAIKSVKDRRDSNRIYEFLRRRAKDGEYMFRSSEAISTVTGLPESRIADLCSKHGHIERKEGERHTWRVVIMNGEHARSQRNRADPGAKLLLIGRVDQVGDSFKTFVDRKIRERRRDERRLCEIRTTKHQLQARKSCVADARSYRVASNGFKRWLTAM
jgi:hypothetical protein